MVEVNTPGSPPDPKQAEFNQKYFQLCAQAGQLQFNIEKLTEELEAKNEDIDAIVREYNEYKKSQETANAQPTAESAPAA